ncbi:MAG TPA: hypothetical protein VEX15_01215 [Nocardioidaceae bacterium]|nr:hypothetical protein [Nocardioidaceae bacterium]
MPTFDLLDEATWRARAAAHDARVEPWIRPHLERRRAGRSHPVEDFCFTYYSYSPSRLRRWHPGAGVVLTGPGAQRYLAYAGYRAGSSGVTADLARLADRLPTVRFVGELMTATADRPAQLGCFGLHEWAMLYRQRSDEIRHAAYPHRLGAAPPTGWSSRFRCGAPTSTRIGSSPRRHAHATRPD